MKTVVEVVVNHPEGTSVSVITQAVLQPMVEAINGADHWSAYTVTVDQNVIADRATRIAFQWVLSEYPDTWSVDQIIDGLERGSDDVIVCEQFEDWSAESVVNHINELAEAIAEGMNQ
jgi:hypothetical protein